MADKTRFQQYQVIFATETPMIGKRFYYNEDTRRYEIRMYKAKLSLTPQNMFASLGSPAGVPILWCHNMHAASFWSGHSWGAAIGRVLTMEFAKKKLVGTISLSERLVEEYVPDGFESIDNGINRGLSLGLQWLTKQPGTWEMRKGTEREPDLLTYGKSRILEASLTPTPKIFDAGIVKKLDSDDEEDATQETEPEE